MCGGEAVGEVGAVARGQIPGSMKWWEWGIMLRGDAMASGCRRGNRIKGGQRMKARRPTRHLLKITLIR